MRDLINSHREAILARDEHTCMMCGTQDGELWETDPSRTKRIQVGSRFLAMAATDLDPADLCALCDECDEGFQEVRLRNSSAAPRAAVQVMATIRRTRQSDQIKVLEWLVNKFPNEAKGLLK